MHVDADLLSGEQLQQEEEERHLASTGDSAESVSSARIGILNSDGGLVCCHAVDQPG